MDTNSYQAVKAFIFNKLSKVEAPLPYKKIDEEIENIKKVIATIGLETFAQILSIDQLCELEDQDWLRLSKELEEHFDVKMQNGILIQGNEQRDRDTTWWTSIEKQKAKNYYWNRYHDYLSKSLSPDVIKTIDVDTDIVMNNLENPYAQSFSRYGMVVGHVQSGKTGNYSALVCKAADAGYKFIVVIAGGINNLRNQTQERLNESFIGQTNGAQVGAGKGNSSKDTMPLSLTTVERDFNKQDADRLSQGLNFDNISVPILLVIKKHTRTLENVIDWLQKQYKNQVVHHAMLVIDDESDYASINTKEEEDPTAINKKLRKLLSLFQKSAYVAYTATPYANIFIDHKAESNDLGRDLFPKDFIYALDAPSNYFGARKIFIDTNNAHLVPISDYGENIPSDHRKDHVIKQLPNTLLEAIRHFLLNISIRSLRGQRDKHNSMLIHATRFTDVHKLLGKQVEDYLTLLREEIVSYGKLPDAVVHGKLIKDIQDTFNKNHVGVEFKWEKVISILSDLIETVVVREVHQKTSVPLEYRKDFVTNAIVVGGTSLSRGYTLEGLSVSYFLRNTVFYDTLMQMGRWFGYRQGYEDLCRIYMPDERITDFADIIRATEDLFQDFKLMAENKRTPNDFGLAVQQNPSSALQITARNKQKNVKDFVFSMQLDGQAKETSYLRSESKDIEHNINAIKRLLDVLPVQNANEGSYVWRAVNKDKINIFLKDFRTFDNDRIGLLTRMPISFIEKYVEERDTDWDIALYNGSGNEFIHKGIKINKELRQFQFKEKGRLASKYYEVLNRQVSSGNAESITIEDPVLKKRIGNNRRAARQALARPLLMLHILEQRFPLETNNESELSAPTSIIPVKEIAAFGVSFPGSVLSVNTTVTLKINTVYYQNLLDEQELEAEYDD